MFLSNKTVIIYGGSGAIGSAIAKAMHQAGANIFLVGRKKRNWKRLQPLCMADQDLLK